MPRFPVCHLHLCKSEARELIGHCRGWENLSGILLIVIQGRKPPHLLLLTFTVEPACLQKIIRQLPVWVWKAKWALGQDFTL